MTPEYIAKRITIRRDQAQWIDEHIEISLSGLVQRAIDEQMNLGKMTYATYPVAAGPWNNTAPGEERK